MTLLEELKNRLKSAEAIEDEMLKRFHEAQADAIELRNAIKKLEEHK